MRKLFIAIAVFICSFCVTSCNVTRKVVTEQSFYQRGDTAVSITTRTIESYDATKKL